MTPKQYIKKNWKSLTLVIAIALLILINVRQYRQNISIYKENTEINTKYSELLKREDLRNQTIARYEDENKRKDSAIKQEKEKVSETEAKLQISQNDVKRLSKKILGQTSIKPEDFAKYTEVCDSLATVAPILSDQVDTLKSQNKNLVNTITEKSATQDSIIKEKDAIISEKSSFLDLTVTSYNKSVDKLHVTENKLAKEKKRKGFWKKLAFGLGIGVAGSLLIK